MFSFGFKVIPEIDKNVVQDEKTVSKFLLETGCCKRCTLRYVGGSEMSYSFPDESVSKMTVSSTPDEPIPKKVKQNPCIVCLDLLHDDIIESMILNPQIDKVQEYDSDTFTNYISFPRSILIREYSMEMYVKYKFPDFFKDRHILPLNKAWSFSIHNKLASRLKKKFDKCSNLQMTFNTSYEFEDKESAVIYKLQTNLKKKNGYTTDLSNKNVTEALKNVDQALFYKNVSLPPETPTTAVTLSEINLKHDFIYIAGRYCKYTRNLWQTPKASDGVIITNSVQEIIFKAIGNIFNCSNMVFSSSGREDFDVRTLGRGRPFFIKIIDPKVTKIPNKQFRQIEKIIKQSKVMSVRDLQITEKKSIDNIKEGEQFKQKTYRALCIINKPENLETYINKINESSEIIIKQKTPLRVFHRRSLDARERKISSLKAKAITGENKIFELDLVSQAGTYIKEFIHGDFGRTTPSLKEIIDGDVDIVALDVLDIDLDFPPPIEYNKKMKKQEN